MELHSENTQKLWSFVFNPENTNRMRLNAAVALMDRSELSIEGYTSLWEEIIL